LDFSRRDRFKYIVISEQQKKIINNFVNI
jgi:hypothetical protein